jgi:hypothetical protein
MLKKTQHITLKHLLIHMQGMEQRLDKKIDGVEQRLDRNIDSVKVKLTRRIDSLERNLTMQIDIIDKRLDAIEIENLPRRITALEQMMR